MIANALFITIALLPALVFWLTGELKFFNPYKLVLWREGVPCCVNASVDSER